MSKKRYYGDTFDMHENVTNTQTYNASVNIKKYKSETCYRENNISHNQILLMLANKMNKYETELTKLNNNVTTLQHNINNLHNNVNKLHTEMTQIKKENIKYKSQLYKLYSYMGLNHSIYTETPSYIS